MLPVTGLRQAGSLEVAAAVARVTVAAGPAAGTVGRAAAAIIGAIVSVGPRAAEPPGPAVTQPVSGSESCVNVVMCEC